MAAMATAAGNFVQAGLYEAAAVFAITEAAFSRAAAGALETSARTLQAEAAGLMATATAVEAAGEVAATGFDLAADAAVNMARREEERGRDRERALDTELQLQQEILKMQGRKVQAEALSIQQRSEEYRKLGVDPALLQSWESLSLVQAGVVTSTGQVSAAVSQSAQKIQDEAGSLGQISAHVGDISTALSTAAEDIDISSSVDAFSTALKAILPSINEMMESLDLLRIALEQLANIDIGSISFLDIDTTANLADLRSELEKVLQGIEVDIPIQIPAKAAIALDLSNTEEFRAQIESLLSGYTIYPAIELPDLPSISLEVSNMEDVVKRIDVELKGMDSLDYSVVRLIQPLTRLTSSVDRLNSTIESLIMADAMRRPAEAQTVMAMPMDTTDQWLTMESALVGMFARMAESYRPETVPIETFMPQAPVGIAAGGGGINVYQTNTFAGFLDTTDRAQLRELAKSLKPFNDEIEKLEGEA